MRGLTIVAILLVSAGCSAGKTTRRESFGASGPLDAKRDSAAVFLLNAAATDFHTHRPPDPVRFRDVRLGHVVTDDGATQYRLCGEFLPAQGREADWVPFATIQTSHYEQWLGATTFCTDPALIWDPLGDLSSSLQRRLDSLRAGKTIE